MKYYCMHEYEYGGRHNNSNTSSERQTPERSGVYTRYVIVYSYPASVYGGYSKDNTTKCTVGAGRFLRIRVIKP